MTSKFVRVEITQKLEWAPDDAVQALCRDAVNEDIFWVWDQCAENVDINWRRVFERGDPIKQFG